MGKNSTSNNLKAITLKIIHKHLRDTGSRRLLDTKTGGPTVQLTAP